jgi:polar amino acid transport system substrate-binding protein
VRKLLLVLTLLAALVAGGCGGDDGEEAGGQTTTAAEEDPCAKESLQLVNPGQLTIGTDNPAFPPWFEGEGEFEPWDPTTPPTKKGYEAELAYAIAGHLGFSDDEVQWTVVPFNQSFRPGPKSFDFDINQISFKPARAEAVDFSDSYYDVEQAVVALEGNPLADAASIADLKEFKYGAQIGTTSLDAINNVIAPSEEPAVYDTNNDAVSALKAKQVDGIVVDFPTALFMAAVQIEGGTVVGRLPAGEGGEYFGLVFEKGNPLVECVNEAIAALKDDGTLDGLEQEWLGGSAPVLE